jgi:hypothetical protein
MDFRGEFERESAKKILTFSRNQEKSRLIRDYDRMRHILGFERVQYCFAGI